MKTLLSLLCLPLLLTLDAAACDCAKAPAPVMRALATTAETNEPKSHPVKGVVKSIMPEFSALMVKHEAVPGVMRAMTMMFKVEPAVLEKVKAGDAIQALMSKREDGWWLHAVEVITSSGTQG